MDYNYNQLKLFCPGTAGQASQWMYTSDVDTLAQVEASGYFVDSGNSEDLQPLMKVGDFLLIYATDGNALVALTGINPITVVALNTAGQELVASVAITAAQFNGMYATPKLLVPAAGANTQLVFRRLALAMTYGSANYASGGTAAVQYDSTANGAGVIASTTLANTVFQAAASSVFTMNPGVVVLPFATTVNKGLYLSNITGAFTTGDSPMVAHVWYSVIATA